MFKEIVPVANLDQVLKKLYEAGYGTPAITVNSSSKVGNDVTARDYLVVVFK